MIPKKIHYFWIGGNPKPESVLYCIESWKKYCPDFEIIEWNETNYDFTKNEYMRQAYEAKKWAFVTDYARLDIIYKYGGIYLDTDVEFNYHGTIEVMVQVLDASVQSPTKRMAGVPKWYGFGIKAFIERDQWSRIETRNKSLHM